MKIPYGFDPLEYTTADDPWTRLNTIDEYLADCEVIPPHLAQWLGQAIYFSKGDPHELLRRLDLKRKRGRPNHKHSERAWLDWGARVCVREDRGQSPEEALDAVLEEYGLECTHDVSRTQLQEWREFYRARWAESKSR